MHVIALLGREAMPTDGVGDYCRNLEGALRVLGHAMDILRVPWVERGWIRALWWLLRVAHRSRGRWVLVQYTAFSWSRWGAPFPVAITAAMLRLSRAKVAVIYHDSVPHQAPGVIGWIRRQLQTSVMRLAYLMADLAVLTVPVSAASWLPSRRKAITIPVGSNLASPLSSQPEAVLPQSAERVVAVFGITGGVHASREARDIGQAIAVAHQTVPGLKLVAFGCGTAAAAEELRCSVSGTPVEVLGLLEAGVAQQRLAQSHALLFVRGEVTAGRTTAVAGVAVGLPIVGYCGPTSGDPIVQAGVSLVPRGRADLLGQALARVLSDSELWSALHRQNREAFERHFSWSSIAHRFLDALRD